MVNAQVVFDLSSTGVLTVTLTNQTASEVSDGQAVTGLKFTLAGLNGSASLSTQSGDEITFNGSAVTDLGVQSLTHWTAGTSLQTVTLTTIGGGQPINSILGPASSDGRYDSGNGSISSAKNPWVEGSATFVLNTLPGFGSLLNATTLTNVAIGFGTNGTNYISTAAGSFSSQTVSPTPEPSTFLLGAGLILGAAARRLLRRG